MKNKITNQILSSRLIIQALLAGILISLNWQSVNADTTSKLTTPAKHILVFGDSLSAAYGIKVTEGWVSLLETELTKRSEQQKQHYRVSNASISGETTTGGLGRLPHTLEKLKPDVVLIELGGNDGLNGLPVAKIQANLENMVELTRATGAQAIVVGIALPPSYGPRYIDQFRAVFPAVAEQYKVPFIDFFDAELFATPGFIQSDGVHPTALAQPIIKDRLLEFLGQNNIIQ